MASVKAQHQGRAWVGWRQREGPQDWSAIGAGGRGAPGGWRLPCLLSVSRASRELVWVKYPELGFKSYIFTKRGLKEGNPR